MPLINFCIVLILADVVAKFVRLCRGCRTLKMMDQGLKNPGADEGRRIVSRDGKLITEVFAARGTELDNAARRSP